MRIKIGVLYRRPFLWLWKLWNPFKVRDKGGRIIKDRRFWKKSAQVSRQERERRKLAGEANTQWFSVKVMRSLDFSGGED